MIKIKGADYNELEKAFAFFHACRDSGKPTVILMTTVKGNGVSYMENQAGWHGKGPNDEECAKALPENDRIRRGVRHRLSGFLFFDIQDRCRRGGTLKGGLRPWQERTW